MPKSFDVFLSHISHDKVEVERVARALHDIGLRVWFDKWELRPGVAWQDELQAAINESGATLIFIGQSGLGPWQQSEMKAALQYVVSDQRPLIPVYLPGATKAELPVFLKQFTGIEIRSWNEEDFHEALSKMVWAITGKMSVPPPPSTAIPKVFLCHAKEDDSHVETLYFRLRDYNIDPWYVKEKLTVGDRWEQEIVQAIENTDFFAICLSPRSVSKTGFIQREIKLAVKEYQRRPQQLAFLLPVRLAPCDVPAIKLDELTTLSDLHWIDLFQCDEESLRQFADGVQRQFAKSK